MFGALGNTVMKRAIAAVFAAIFFALSVCAAQASDFSTELSITVPQQYHIRFSIEGEGTVTAGRAGKTFDVTDGGEVIVTPDESLTLCIIPGKGYALSGVSAGGENLTGQVKNGVLITPGFQKDQTVSVVFKQQTEEPTATQPPGAGTVPPSSGSTGGKGTLSTGDLSVTAAAAVLLAGTAAVVLLCRKKRKAADR